MGNLTFRARVSSYPLKTFEDTAIFVFDVERCLQELDGFSRELIGRVVLQEYTPEATARALQCSVRSIERRVADALDEMSEVFLRRGILPRSSISPKSCQGGKNGIFPASDWKEGK
jgi:DNA-directed RNA polymerase specialized sigma24 family protein